MKQLKKGVMALNNRVLVFCFVFIFSSFLVLGSTFAWVTSSSHVENKFLVGYLRVDLVERFNSAAVLSLEPGLHITKDTRVHNVSKIPSIVRVSFSEALLSFKIDTTDRTGNGNLFEQTTEHATLKIDVNNVNTWKTNATLKSPYSNHYLVGNHAVSPMTPYKWNDPTRNENLKYLEFEFNTSLKTWTDVANNPSLTDFWVYQDGYFYYSEPLKPGEMTTPLLDRLVLSRALPNELKSSLYKMDTNAEAVSSTFDALDSWNIPQTSDVYGLLNPKLDSLDSND